MSDEAIVKAACYFIRAAGGKPSIRTVSALIRTQTGRGWRYARIAEAFPARATVGQQSGNSRATVLSVAGNTPVTAGNLRARDLKVLPLSKESLSRSEIDFGDYERDVSAFVALLAEKNASGKVTAPRVASVRAELSEWRERFGNDAMLAGVRAAIDHDVRKPVPYARAVAEHFHDPGRATNGKRPESDEPEIPDFLDLFPNGVAP